ncbi:hypothetical protein HF289_10040 [Acidithiobacillus ferrooxidans]|jgi:hypothetical protein|uniref:hypothetical protein n=1 Tax=Acidithiobacillus ferrooxidans TaxID=920 RepID=UPI001C06CBCD|nr:hypothetical protein [Acidithiobacillus ferrooxidans]MBU2857190.1 hypothetical protein [Acidithiobacillus ferrooxidans]
MSDVDLLTRELARGGLTPGDVPHWALVTGAQATADLGRGEGQKIHCDCVQIPYHDLDGSPIVDAGLPFARYHLLQAEVVIGGKYLSRQGSGGHIYVPPRLRELLASMADADQYLVVADGEKEAEALIKAGVPAVGLASITLWHDVAAHRAAQEEAQAAGKKIHVTKDTPLHPELLVLFQELGIRTVVAMGDSDGKPEVEEFFTPDLIAKKTFKVIGNKQEAISSAVANASVFFSVKALAGALRKAGLQETVMFCPWAEGKKADGSRVLDKQGAGDWLLADGADAVRHAVEQRVAEHQEKAHARPPRLITGQNSDFALDGHGFIPLGVKDASNAAFWSLRAGEIYEINLTKITNVQGLLPLVPLESAYDLWPKVNEKTGEVSANVPSAVNDLMQTSLARGRFSLSAVRGAGCWPGDQPEDLVVNGSDGVYLLRSGEPPKALQPCDPGRKSLYVSRPVGPKVVGDEMAAAADIMNLVRFFQNWSWVRPRTDPLLLAGWILMQALLGTLQQRPHAFLTGESGAGKTTLVNILRSLLRGSMIYSEAGGESSAAGVRQRMSPDAITLILDEFEPDKKPSRFGQTSSIDGIFSILRTAYSSHADAVDDADGALKGTQDGKRGQVYRSIFSCLMAGIQMSTLDQADRNRLIIFELLKLHGGVVPTLPDAESLGIGLRRLMWSRWSLWRHRHADVLAALSLGSPASDARTKESLAPPIAALACAIFGPDQDDQASAFIGEMIPLVVEDHIEHAAGGSGSNETDQEKALRRLLSANVVVEDGEGGRTNRTTMPLARVIVGSACFGDQLAYSEDQYDRALQLVGMSLKRKDAGWALFIGRGHSGQDAVAKAAGYPVALHQLLGRLPGVDDARALIGPSRYRGIMIPMEPLIFKDFAAEMRAFRDAQNGGLGAASPDEDPFAMPFH